MFSNTQLVQTTLFGRAAKPSFDPRMRRMVRHALDERGAWVDHAQGWVDGHETLFVELEAGMQWRVEQRVMYERRVDVPRLIASVPEDGDAPILHDMAASLGRRYGVRFESIMLALYRDGSDSVAFHRDKELRDQQEALVAVASLGGMRRFALRPFGGGPSRTFRTGWGDLYVMGGTTQRAWEHAIPKMQHADPRMAVMFRPGSSMRTPNE